MKIPDILAYAYHNLRARKLRSWLTILGIILGVTAIITLISLANGVNAQISARLTGLGNNVIQITPGYTAATRSGGGNFFAIGAAGGAAGGGSRAPGGFAGTGGGGPGGFGQFARSNEGELTADDANTLRRLPGVAALDVRLQGRVRASLHGKNASITIVGVIPLEFNKMAASTPLIAGRNLGTNDKFSAVVGFGVHNNTFAAETLLNRQLKLNTSYGEYAVRVVGLLNQSTGSQVVADNAVYVPFETAKTLLNETNPGQLIAQSADGYDPDEVAGRLNDELVILHHVSPTLPDFTITTASFIQSTIGDVTNMLALFLGGIAAVSLIVGGIGVANTMFMSVLERTKEIGTLKALGLRDGSILQLFLVEAAAIGLVGGVIGILLSYFISYLLSLVKVPSLITPELVAIGLLFSAGIGVVSGLVPARNASKLEPVEALRYE